MSSVDSFPTPSQLSPKAGEPAWDLALMYPLQGGWTVDNYLRLDAGLLIEYSDGFIRVLPMPNLLQQWIARFMFDALHSFVRDNKLGEVFFAPLPVKLTTTKYREPDVVFLRPARIEKLEGQPAGADLVVEVVSEGQENRDRDYVEKRAEYAAAGIPEYWIVDPQEKKITVLTLANDDYDEHGVFARGEEAKSALLAGFGCQVSDVFSRCDESVGTSL